MENAQKIVLQYSPNMHVQRTNIWCRKLAFCALLSHAEQIIFQIIFKERLKSCAAFSLALDKSTDISNTAQLVIFIRTVTVGPDVVEEFIDVARLSSTTTGQDIGEHMIREEEKF